MKSYALKPFILDAGAIVAGSGLVALGLVLFTIPNDIAPGGVSGLATALASISPIQVGAWTLLLNIPIIAVAWWRMGLRPIVKTIASTLLLSVAIDLMSGLIPPYTNNPLLSAVLGGVLCGAGMGVIFLRGASTGGTDLVSLLLHRAFPNMSVGMLLMIVDAAVVVFAVLVFRQLEVALYSIVTLFVTSKTVDSLMQGVDYAKVIYVVTDCGEEINRRLMDSLDCGVTMLDATGGYTGKQKRLLMIVVRRNSFVQTLSAVKEIDPAAFLYVANATEVHGEGFKPMA